MKNCNDDFQDVSPLENYTAPKLPMLDDGNTALLKKLPSRWQKNAKVLTGAGIAGMIAFGGVTALAKIKESDPHHGGAPSMPIYLTQPTEQQLRDIGYNLTHFDIEVQLHYGGGGHAFYVAHITEQEALGIIRAQLEMAGLRFSDAVPDFKAFVDDEYTSEFAFGLDLYDKSKNVGVAFVDSLSWYFFHPQEEDIKEEFAAFDKDMKVGLFYNPNTYYLGNGFIYDDETNKYIALPLEDPTAEEKAKYIAAILNNITEEVDAFVYDLQEEGILAIPTDQLQKPDSITITLDGKPMALTTAPIMEERELYEQEEEWEKIMVPFFSVFEALGMEVEWVRDKQTAIAIDKNIKIILSIGDDYASVNGQDVWIQNPATLVNGTIMVPLWFAREYIDANVRWHERTQTVIITTN